MSITTVTVYPDTVPARTQGAAAFADNADDFVAWLKQLGDELAVTIPEMNTDIAQANTDASTATDAKNAALAAANFQGEWSDQSGSAAIPYAVTNTVSSTKRAYMLIQALADVTTVEPGVTSGWESYWAVIYEPAESVSVIENETYIRSYSPSAVASADIDVSEVSDYDFVRVKIDLTISVGTDFRIRTSSDGGSTFNSSSTDYAYSEEMNGSNFNDASNDYIALPQNAPNDRMVGTIDLKEWNDASTQSLVIFDGKNVSTSSYIQQATAGGSRKANEANDFLRIFLATGNFTGSIHVYGVNVTES